MSNLKEFRAEKDKFFASHPQSPLSHAQKHTFEGLKYFPENPALRLEVIVEVSPTQETVSIQTSGGVPQKYQRYGRFKFDVDGQTAELTLYSSEDGFFLPFADSLAGRETYRLDATSKWKNWRMGNSRWISTWPTTPTAPIMSSGRAR